MTLISLNQAIRMCCGQEEEDIEYRSVVRVRLSSVFYVRISYFAYIKTLFESGQELMVAFSLHFSLNRSLSLFFCTNCIFVFVFVCVSKHTNVNVCIRHIISTISTMHELCKFLIIEASKLSV